MIALFAERIRRHVDHDHYQYHHPEPGIAVEAGSPQEHAVSYRLVVKAEHLGEILLSRGRGFGPHETQFMENALTALLLPLRNALLYHTAMQAALKDPLTGVHNRTALDQAILREIQLARRHGLSFSVMMLDIDHFKQVNDRRGHVAGDDALKTVARCIEGCIRSSDMLFRYGGEEFLALLSSTDSEGAKQLAERIRETIESTTCRFHGGSFAVTVSIGAAGFVDDESGLEIVERADAALYRAKRLGRNCVCMATSTEG